MGVIASSLSDLITTVGEAYRAFLYTLPPQMQVFLNLFLLTLVVVVYAVFVWKFYTFISTKNILQLNLNKYNKIKHKSVAKVVASVLYLVEYIIIFPLLIFFWFTLFTILLSVLTKGIAASAVILIAGIIVAAVRVSTYIPRYGESLAREIAKIVPFALLGLSMTDPTFFSLGAVLDQITQLQPLFAEIKFYVVFLVVLEFILRGATFVMSLFKKGKGMSDEQGEYLDTSKPKKK